MYMFGDKERDGGILSLSCLVGSNDVVKLYMSHCLGHVVASVPCALTKAKHNVERNVCIKEN
mgnify:CR=1 FL=1